MNVSEPIAENLRESDVKIDYRLMDYVDENKIGKWLVEFPDWAYRFGENNTTEWVSKAKCADRLVNIIKELEAKPLQ